MNPIQCLSPRIGDISSSSSTSRPDIYIPASFILFRTLASRQTSSVVYNLLFGLPGLLVFEQITLLLSVNKARQKIKYAGCYDIRCLAMTPEASFLNKGCLIDLVHKVSLRSIGYANRTTKFPVNGSHELTVKSISTKRTCREYSNRFYLRYYISFLIVPFICGGFRIML